jgi:hypothetical protein
MPRVDGMTRYPPSVFEFPSANGHKWGGRDSNP